MFVAVFSERFDGGASSPSLDELRRTLDPSGRRNVLVELRDGPVVIVAVGDHAAAGARAENRSQVDDLVVAHCGRLDNRSELANRYGLKPAAPTETVVREAFRSDDEGCVASMRGAFSFVVYDRRTTRVFAARDQLGLRPLWFSHRPGQLILSSTAASFHLFRGVADRPSREWMAHYLLGVSISAGSHPWEDVDEIAPGYHHSWDRGRESKGRIKRYFRFDAQNDPVSRDDAAWITAYRDELSRATREQADSRSALGVEISGGIDSSTLLAMAAHHRQNDLDSIHGLGFAMYEREPEFILETSRHCGITNNHVFADRHTSNPDESIRRAVQALGHPPEHAVILGHAALFERCESIGIDVLLSGFGGDEAVTNPGDRVVHELLRRRPFALPRQFRGSVTRRLAMTARAAQRELRGINQRRFEEFLLDESRKRWPYVTLSAAVVAEFDLERLHRHHLDLGPRCRSLNEWAIDGRLSQPFVARRTAHGAVVAHAYGIDYRWPLLDIDLIAQWLATPTDLKARNGVGRYLHREALCGIVPDSVLFNPNKYMGSLRVATATTHTVEAHRLCDSLHPALRELLDVPRYLEQAIEIDARPSHTVTLGWTAHRRTTNHLRMLNSWLQDYYPG